MSFAIEGGLCWYLLLQRDDPVRFMDALGS